jgi:capsular exopolysaccharide synthesis family protein
VDLRRQISVVRSYYRSIAACVLLAAATAFLVSNLLPRVYVAETSMLVGQSLTAVNPDYNQLLASQRLSQTYAQVALTRPVLERVAAKLGLDTTPAELGQRIQADAPRDSTLIRITASDVDPERAAAIANAVAEELIAASPSIQGHQATVLRFVDEDLARTQTQIEEIQAEVQRLSGLTVRSEQQEIELAAHENKLVSLRATYATLLAFSSSSSSNLLSVVEPAIVPLEPSSPRPLLNTALAAVLGLVLGLAVAFARDHLDDTIKSAEDIEQVTRLATLGQLMRMRGDPSRSEIYRLAALLYPRSPAAEAFRTLRTNIDFASVDTRLSTLLITSSLSGEGKTTVAGNLALVFAQTGRRTLLVDADLRRPGVHRLFDLPNSRGLTTILLGGETDISEIAHATEEPMLHVLTSGPLPPNPAELLDSRRMHTLIDQFKGLADLVIFDSPPLHAVTDAAILASGLDGTLFVIEAGRTRRDAARHGREALAKVGARVLGAALNRHVGQMRSEYYEYYGEGPTGRPEADRDSGLAAAYGTDVAAGDGPTGLRTSLAKRLPGATSGKE